MLLNRIILVIFIIAAGVFASLYGGNVSYAIFYMSLTIPLVSFIYTFYVYVRFRLYQEISQRVVVKGDLTPYSFTIANEDYITFRSIKVNFLSDKSDISNAEGIQEYCLLPNTSETLKTKLRCHYRGEYYVGANSVDIIDFLYLFKITYPVRSKLKVSVLPRVVSINHLSVAPPQKDTKNTPYIQSMEKEYMGIDTRKYVNGDSKKQIHWKVSAKRNELYSRNYITNPKSEVVIFMDLQKVNEEELTTFITEDKIIESTIAIVNYCKNNNNRARIYYDQDGMQCISIASKVDFDLFYELCVTARFTSNYTLDHLIELSQTYEGTSNFNIIITHLITQHLYKSIVSLFEKGNDIAVLLIRDIVSDEEEDIIESLRVGGISVIRITREDEIGEVLS
jgi:uncharacterized protein (DUF58 family)